MAERDIESVHRTAIAVDEIGNGLPVDQALLGVGHRVRCHDLEDYSVCAGRAIATVDAPDRRSRRLINALLIDRLSFRL
jgi:hypothetical protein